MKLHHKYGSIELIQWTRYSSPIRRSAALSKVNSHFRIQQPAGIPQDARIDHRNRATSLSHKTTSGWCSWKSLGWRSTSWQAADSHPPFNWLTTTALPSWTHLLCLRSLSRQKRLCNLIQLWQGLGHEMRHLSHVHTKDKPVDWAGFNTYLDRQEASTSTKKQSHWWYLAHFSMRHLPILTRSWRHSSTWKRPWRLLECNTHTARSTNIFIRYRVWCNGATLTAGNIWCCIPGWCIR